MTASFELEELRKRKAALEDESYSLEQKQMTLAEKREILGERLAIQKLEDDNEAKRGSIEKLEAELSELESKVRRTDAEPEGPIPEDEQAMVVEPMQGETTEPDVIVAPIENPPEIQEAESTAEELIKHHEKKKRRLF